MADRSAAGVASMYAAISSIVLARQGSMFVGTGRPQSIARYSIRVRDSENSALKSSWSSRLSRRTSMMNAMLGLAAAM